MSLIEQGKIELDQVELGLPVLNSMTSQHFNPKPEENFKSERKLKKKE